jgi:hypothetical protein
MHKAALWKNFTATYDRGGKSIVDSCPNGMKRDARGRARALRAMTVEKLLQPSYRRRRFLPYQAGNGTVATDR